MVGLVSVGRVTSRLEGYIYTEELNMVGWVLVGRVTLQGLEGYLLDGIW